MQKQLKVLAMQNEIRLKCLMKFWVAVVTDERIGVIWTKTREKHSVFYLEDSNNQMVSYSRQIKEAPLSL